MLRIDVRDENESTSFTVEGTLSGPATTVLENCWKSAVETQPSRPIIVRLAAVTFVDLRCKELLARMRESGVKLVPQGCLMKVIVEQIEGEIAARQQGGNRPDNRP